MTQDQWIGLALVVMVLVALAFLVWEAKDGD